MSFRSLLAALAVIVLSACTATPRPEISQGPEARAPVTILISVDGLRPDYLDRGVSPNINALAAGGVKASMRPSFPSITFPNHHAIVTGLRPDRHGIIDNNMEDPRRPGVRFTLGDARQALDPFWWDAAEPIWTTAEKAGVRTATMFWPGSEVPTGETRPRDWMRYDKAIGNTQRINTVIDWVRRPAAIRPRFVTLYFDTVDTAGHMHGPDADATNHALAEVDARIGELVAGLEALGQPANLVLVSDHGMAASSADRVIRIDRLVDAAAMHVVSDGPFAGINPLAGGEATVAAKLLTRHEHMQCWRKAELPERFAYGRNPRVPAILCLAEPGWMILWRDPDRELPKGMHGYDNGIPEMAAVFVANGPAIDQAARPGVFDNVDVYPLLARLIGIAPAAAVDGNAATLAGVLRAK